MPLGVLRAALNLLPYEPNSIFISGADFYLSFPHHTSDYVATNQRDRVFHQWSTMNGHDLLANLELAKILVSLCLIDGDERFRRAAGTPIDEAAQIYDHLFLNLSEP